MVGKLREILGTLSQHGSFGVTFAFKHLGISCMAVWCNNVTCVNTQIKQTIKRLVLLWKSSLSSRKGHSYLVTETFIWFLVHSHSEHIFTSITSSFFLYKSNVPTIQTCLNQSLLHTYSLCNKGHKDRKRKKKKKDYWISQDTWRIYNKII